jgi:hypothetical protein
MPNARNKLQLLRQSVLGAHPETGRANRRNANGLNNTGTWRQRVLNTVNDINTCLALLDESINTAPVTLQQVVHFTQRCSGPSCAREDSPIYGHRYECGRCGVDFCNDCFGQHDPHHVLSLHRAVLPAHAATATSQWEVLSIDSHQDSNSGRLYRVVWAGNWEPEFVTRTSLNNDELVDRHTRVCTSTPTFTISST